MAFNIMSLFGRGAQNMLLQPQATDPGNMLVAPLQNRPDPTNYPVAGIQPDPMTTAAVASPAPQQAAGPQVAQAGPGLPSFGLDGDRKAFLQDMFLGWAAGSTPTQSLALGAAQAAGGRRDRKGVNETVSWLTGRGLDEASARQLAGNPTALSAYLKDAYSPQDSKLLSAGGSLYDPATKEWIVPPTGASRQTEYGLAPIYGTDANGNTVIGQLAKDGTFQQTELPQGFQPTPGISNTDLGTSVITRDSRTGQIIDTQAKDVSGAAQQGREGTNTADAKAALPGIETAANVAISTIDSLKNDPYLSRMVGSLDSRLPNFTSDAARVQGKMDQLQGQAFLQAFNSLKGGGAITEVEGLKAERAIARLNAAQNEADYTSALNDLRSVIQEGVENARRKAGGGSSPTSAAQPQAQQGAIRRFNPETGMIE